MATFAELEQAVYEITVRPDLQTLTRQSLRAAIVAAHSLQDWERDLVVADFAAYVVPSVSSESMQPNFQDFDLPAQYRQANRILADMGEGVVIDAFKREQKPQLYLYGGSREPYTYRVVGNQIRIGFVGAPVAIGIEYYSFPSIDTATPNTDSWIAASALHEFIVIHAAQRVLRSIGMADDARALDFQLAEARADLLANYS